MEAARANVGAAHRHGSSLNVAQTMKTIIVIFSLLLAPSLASDAIRISAMGWVDDSESSQSRALGICELSVRVTVFNDGDAAITLPSLILSNVAIWNSKGSPALLLTYTPWITVTSAQKKYPRIPSREAFFPVEIRPGESAHVKMEGTVSWDKDPSLIPSAVILRTTGFLSERLGFTAVDLKSGLDIVDRRMPVRPVKVSPTADSRWLKVDEGFQFLIPSDWKDKEARGIDSHVGDYVGPRAYLEFDEVFGLGYTVERSQNAVENLKKKEADASLLKPGEVVWHVDGHIALFTSSKVDPKTFGNREYPNVASLFVPYEGEPGYLSVHLFYADYDYLRTASQILRSFTWPKNRPNPESSGSP